MAAEISNQLTTSAEVHLTALAGARSAVPVNNNDEDSCEINGGDGDRIVSVDVPNGDDDRDYATRKLYWYIDCTISQINFFTARGIIYQNGPNADLRLLQM